MFRRLNRRRGHSPERDSGMTLVELVISVSLLGLITAVISTAIIVTLRQQDNTDGRLNVARAEQSISMWIPADLSSASTVDTSPAASPCRATVCDDVLMLSWTTVTAGGGSVETNVSYHFAPSPDGLTYELSRVECTSNGGGWSCSTQVVLRDLPGPPGGADFVPGVANGAACDLE